MLGEQMRLRSVQTHLFAPQTHLFACQTYMFKDFWNAIRSVGIPDRVLKIHKDANADILLFVNEFWFVLVK